MLFLFLASGMSLVPEQREDTGAGLSHSVLSQVPFTRFPVAPCWYAQELNWTSECLTTAGYHVCNYALQADVYLGRDMYVSGGKASVLLRLPEPTTRDT